MSGEKKPPRAEIFGSRNKNMSFQTSRLPTNTFVLSNADFCGKKEVLLNIQMTVYYYQLMFRAKGSFTDALIDVSFMFIFGTFFDKSDQGSLNEYFFICSKRSRD